MSETVNNSNFEYMFKGMQNILRTDTIIGDPVKIDDATIVPIMEASFGMGSGEFEKNNKGNAGGVGAKLTPVALLVVQNGMTKLVQVKGADAVSKAIDLIPDLVSRVNGKKISPEILEKAKKLAKNASEEE